MLRPVYDFILQVFSQVVEIVAVTGNPDYKITV